VPFVTSRWSSDRNAVVWQTSPDLETQSEMVWLISYRFRTLQQANVFTPFLEVFNSVFAEASWWRRLGIVSCFPRYSMFSTLIWHPLLSQTIIRAIIAATLSSLCVKCKHYKFQVWSDCEKINSCAVEIFEIDKGSCLTCASVEKRWIGRCCDGWRLFWNHFLPKYRLLVNTNMLFCKASNKHLL